MDLKQLPFSSSLEQYQRQAQELLEGYRSGESDAIRFIKGHHPRFRDEKTPWLQKDVADSEVQSGAFEPADIQLALARWYDFQNWVALAEYAEAVTRENSPVYQFEAAVEAVIAGDLATLKSLLRENPELVQARSTRVTPFDPPVHRATLLTYIAANGVEGYRQKSPKNAVEVARILLKAGAEVDALAELYGGECTTMSLLVSSCHPAEAGVQVALVDTLLDFGASIEGRGSGKWVSPLMTALVFGYRGAAEALVRRGARVDNIETAAGLGRLADARQLIAPADPDSKHRALALAAQLGHVDVVRLLLDAGEDPNRYNPEGTHSHSTPIHQAVAAGHEAVVRLLVERGARLDVKDRIYQSTPLGWAIYCEKPEIEKYLRGQQAAE
jgi:ankyrin repeat protein